MAISEFRIWKDLFLSGTVFISGVGLNIYEYRNY